MPSIQEQYDELMNTLQTARKQAEDFRKSLAAQEAVYKETEDLFIPGKLAECIKAYSMAANQAENKMRTFMEENLEKLPLMAEYEALCKQHVLFQSSGIQLLSLLSVMGVRKTEFLTAQMILGNMLPNYSEYQKRVEILSGMAAEPARLKQKFALPGKQRKRIEMLCNAVKDPARVKSEQNIQEHQPRDYRQSIETIRYGTYPQTKSGNDSTPIEWQILEHDRKNNRMLLISRYGLDVQTYNTDDKNVTWETCSIRTWLNSTFISRAFSREEQHAILTTSVDNSETQCFKDWNAIGGRNTRDKYFCSVARKQTGTFS